MSKYEEAIEEISKLISDSKNIVDASHAKNTLHWLIIIRPDADDILKIAAYAHDIERAMPDRLNKDDFDEYSTYKLAHSKCSGVIASKIALNVGYTPSEAEKVAHLIELAEFSSSDEDVQSICDADSISFFDNNADEYLNKNGVKATKQKMNFMYSRASGIAKNKIVIILEKKKELDLLNIAK